MKTIFLPQSGKKVCQRSLYITDCREKVLRKTPQADSYHPTPRRQKPNWWSQGNVPHPHPFQLWTLPLRARPASETLSTMTCKLATWRLGILALDEAEQGFASLCGETSWKTPSLVNLWCLRKLDLVAPGTWNTEVQHQNIRRGGT